jgi:hypothetical protein
MYPTRPAQRTYLPRRLRTGACASALAAADLAVLENLRSLITFEAAWAAFFPVCRGFFGMIVLFLGALRPRTQDVMSYGCVTALDSRPGCNERPARYGRAFVFQQVSDLLNVRGEGRHRADPPVATIQFWFALSTCCICCNSAHFQLQPLVDPHPSQT